MVDTCAAEFAAETPYYYSVYGDEKTENEAVATPDKKENPGTWFRPYPYWSGY